MKFFFFKSWVPGDKIEIHKGVKINKFEGPEILQILGNFSRRL